jgi:FixJ family two-component response regulator
MPPKLIAVVDDDASIRRALGRLLQAAGYVVETFASASELLDSAAIGHISCLVLDIQLSDMTGFELRERLAEARVAIPIIFITAHDDAATRERVRQSGVRLYLRKPFEKRVLLGAIGRALAVGGEDPADGRG